MEILIILAASVAGLLFAGSVAVFYLGCLGVTMAALNNGRIVWGSLTFFIPPLSLLFALKNRQLVGWAYGFITKGGAMTALLLGLGWASVHLMPMPQHNTGQLMERLLPKPADQASAPAQAGPVQQ
ncbi:hypothetical protein PQU95_14605 [Vogesella sp. DC21W]|uniref:Uncharacterized protein n=1 Tax=Vogesella aquatica TaxID=2984206 RepID=A0ABT5J0S5_9NEIS|nr:hypothetical protein [Vogesella aquatica]MDC7718441.1 hypothetical protein [Vogesella aquatica]